MAGQKEANSLVSSRRVCGALVFHGLWSSFCGPASLPARRRAVQRASVSFYKVCGRAVRRCTHRPDNFPDSSLPLGDVPTARGGYVAEPHPSASSGARSPHSLISSIRPGSRRCCLGCKGGPVWGCLLILEERLENETEISFGFLPE